MSVEQFESVTTIIENGLGKGEGLISWAASETAKAAIQSRGTIDQMLADLGEDETVFWLAGARFRLTKKAQIRGTVLHAAAEQHALGATPMLEPQYVPYFERYLEWLETYEPRFLMAEAPVYNPAYRYAGTLDGIVDLGGRTVLYDIKTTDKDASARSRPPYSEVSLQLTAYSRATHVGVAPPVRTEEKRGRLYDFDPDAKYEPMPTVDAAICVVVSPYDCFAKFVRIDEWSWDTFLYAREIARWHGRYNELFGATLLARRKQEVA